MSSIIKNKQINFKVNSEYFDLAKIVFKEHNLDITSAFNQFIQEVAVTQKMPFKTIEEKQREELIIKLQNEVSASYIDLKNNKGLSIDEARKAILE